MNRNDSHVVTSASVAREHLTAADAYHSTLRELHSTSEGYRDRQAIGDANAGLGYALKAAEVCALLAIEERLARLARLLAPSDRVITL